MKRETFICYSDWYDYCEGMTAEQKANLFDCIRGHAIACDRIRPLPEVQFVWNRIKKQLDDNDEKYKKICEAAAKNAGIRWSKAKGCDRMPPHTTACGLMPEMLDTDTVTYSKNKESKSADADGVPPTLPLPEESDKQETPEPEETRSKLSLEIDDFIAGLKELCAKLDVAYDKEDERKFARHLLVSKDYGAMCERKEQSRLEFAKRVLVASKKYGYRKGVCAGPKMIYQEYSEVYNLAKTQKEKQEKQDKPTYRPLPPNFR